MSADINKNKKNILWSLLLIAEVLIAIKTIPLFWNTQGPQFLPDENCILEIGRYFIHNFRLKECGEIFELATGKPEVLYSILLSPIFLFTTKMDSYYSVLFFNIILTTSTIFPLYKIFAKYIKKTSSIYTAIILILLLPQITIFEKLALTETLFYTLGIWCTYFYIQSFETKYTLNKIIAIILSILAAITRPFGFIFPFAIALNEVMTGKNKIKKIIIVLPLIIVATLPIIYGKPELVDNIFGKFNELLVNKEWLILLEALKIQFNSFLLASMVIPFVIFHYLIFYDKEKPTKSIRIYLMVLIWLSFVIAGQHIFQYLVYENRNPGALTRYINFPLILIQIYFLIFIFSKKQFKFNVYSIITICLCLFSLLLNNSNEVSFTLNLDLLSEINVFAQNIFNDTYPLSNFYSYLLLPLAIVLFVLLGYRKKIIILIIIFSIIISQSILGTIKVMASSSETPIKQNIEDENKNILFIFHKPNKIMQNEAEQLSITTNNNIQVFNLQFNMQDLNNDVVKNFTRREIVEDLKLVGDQKDKIMKADYIVTEQSFEDMQLLIIMNNGMKLYKRKTL